MAVTIMQVPDFSLRLKAIKGQALANHKVSCVTSLPALFNKICYMGSNVLGLWSKSMVHDLIIYSVDKSVMGLYDFGK